MKKLALGLSVALAALIWLASVAAAQSKPEYKLGFKALADQIPSEVGDPLENEHWEANGDSLQQTTGGLMVWRKADNWTAFTDGSRTWINGLDGVQQRGNDYRFPWEAGGPVGDSGQPYSAPDGDSGQSYSDPFGYCTAVGTVDEPDGRYVGPAKPDSIVAAIRSLFPNMPPEAAARGLSWRCLKGQPLACEVGANLPCGKVNSNDTPTPQMSEFCQNRPDSDFIPAAITGHETIYSWKCSGTNPVVDKQVVDVDSQGFGSNYWYQLVPDEYLKVADTPRSVKVGDRFDVILKSNPTTGFKWSLALPYEEGPVRLVGSRYEASPLSNSTPPVVGAGGEEVWTFEAVSKGTAYLAFNYQRPWESVQPVQRYAVAVRVN
ncbi:MAG TPA: protease inhibitor I42 family protein [Chloroflexota bacterium]|nr:protease inhibitor I42 family protein [Chloroflexota bacterium]